MEELQDEVYEFKMRVTSERYYSEDTAWGAYMFYTFDDIPFFTNQTYADEEEESTGKRKNFASLSGRMQQLTTNCDYRVRAVVKNNSKYGKQYEPIIVSAIVPTSRDNQLLFLKSLISSQVAENLIDAYPNLVNDVVNGDLKDIDYNLVKGVREKTWEKIKNKIEENYLISDIIIMLRPLGVTYTMIRKLLDDEPNPVLLKRNLEQNPYIILKINGIGFKRCDELAIKLKPEMVRSKERLVAFVSYFFQELGENSGHTWCTSDELKNAIINNVPECIDNYEWLLGNEDFLHIDNDKVGLRYFYDIEMNILSLIKQRMKVETNAKFSDEIIQKAIDLSEKEQGFSYTEEQLHVIKQVLGQNVSFITGKAGTGKSSIMRAILKAYSLNQYTISASALSAMAAQRVTEATGYGASTIHRTLGCKGATKFTYNKEHQLVTDLAFLDEGSMVNASLFLQWLESIDMRARIIIAGDHKQLPPIGFGNVFSDLISLFKRTATGQLTKPMRQALKSGILSDANEIRENKNPIKETITSRMVHGELQDMYYMFRDNRQSLFNIAVKTYLKSVELEGLDNVVIAVPRKSDCINSTASLNNCIQSHLLGDVIESIEGYNGTFKLGAKVIQTVNDYDNNVFNGEVGYITHIGEELENNKKEAYCEVTYKSDGKTKHVKYNKKDLRNIDLAYAMSVHKLQGSGKKTVIGIIDNTHYQLLDNCLLYTLLTRAKKRCLLLAEPQAFLRCIRTSNNRRNTWLSELKH